MTSASLSSPSASDPRAVRGDADVLLVGAGLANSLIALRLKAGRPDLRVVALDGSGAAEGDAHTWSFFASDVTAEVTRWLAPLADHRWDGYAVRFPTHARRFATAYASLTGGGLRRAVEAVLGEDLRFGCAAATVSPGGVTLRDGRRLRAPLVIDGRGARRSTQLSLAWQKFVGLELEIEGGHGLTQPVIMDATVEQLDGYRFVYLLPFTPERVLVEDTYYSNVAALDAPTLEGRALAYAAARGWRVRAVLAREQGVLPIALGGDIEAFLAEGEPGLPAVGLRAPLFHPVTGYSLPEAAALADDVASAPELTSAAVAERVGARVRRRWRETAYLRALNRIMFLAAEPAQRYKVLQRFYRLPEPLIERFYAGAPSLSDRIRILTGAPPVRIGRALKALPESALTRSEAL